KYLLPSGQQLVTISGQVVEQGSTTPACCQDSFLVSAHSGRPVIAVTHVPPGGATSVVLPMTGNQSGLASPTVVGLVSVRDDAGGFRVLNPSPSPIYASVTGEPVVTGETLFQPPDPQTNATFPARTDLFTLPEEATSTETLPLVQGTAGGRVRLKLFALHPPGSAIAPREPEDQGVALIFSEFAALLADSSH